MALIVLLLLIVGCGPHIDPRVRGGCAGVGDPAACERVHQASLEEWQATQAPELEVAMPPGAYQPSQRVFIRAWHAPGTPFRNAPLGYFDIP
jgi:hypothetical protein